VAISIDPPSGAGADLTVREEGSAVDTTTTDIDFAGAGVTATASGSAVRVEIPGGGDVSSSSTIGDNKLVRGDGGSKGIQDSGVTVDDSDNLTGVGTIRGADGTAGAPAFGFTGDNRQGLWRSGTSTIVAAADASTNLYVSTGEVRPDDDNSTDLGGASNSWKDGYVHGNLYLDDDNDTSVGSDADDQIQITCSGVEVAEFRTNQVVLGNDVGLVFEEVANVPGGTPAAGTGTVWLHSDVPNTLHFTDDSGTDHDLVSDVYGDIYVESGTTTQVTNGSADTFDVVTGFNTTEGSNGEFSGTNPVKASNKITLDKPGRYMVTFTCSYEGTSNTIYTLKAFIGGAAVPSSQFQRKIGTGSDVGSSSFQGILSATAGQDLDVRVSSPDTSVNFIPRFMNLSALWIGI